MEFIRDIHARKKSAGQPVISMEFFPAKTEEGERTLLEKTLPALRQCHPDYCSVTYGAGGGSREKTLTLVDRMQRELGLTTMSHLTCVSATADEIREVLLQARGLGIQNILALRGDPQGGNSEFTKTESGFDNAWQLVRFIQEMGGFCIGVAGFPEGHVACKEGREADWDHLKAKIDCGADFVLTQLFFSNADFFRFRDYLSRKGVTVPICPGIIPILSAAQITRFTTLCGADLPDGLAASLQKFAHDDEACAQFGIEYATAQCAELLRAGAPGLHFYTLNKARSTAAILRNLGLSGA